MLAKTRGDWIVMEAKGRSARFDREALVSAKRQTRRLKRVGGNCPALRVAVECHFKGDIFRVTWQDPDEYDDDAPDVDLTGTEFLEAYYQPFQRLFSEGRPEGEQRQIGSRRYRTIPIGEVGLTIGVDVQVLAALEAQQWADIPSILAHVIHDTELQRIPGTKIGGDGVL